MRPGSYAEFRTRLLTIYRGPGHSVRTMKKMAYVLGLVAHLGVTRLTDLTTELVARFVAERSKTVSANTVRGELSYLKAAANYAVEEGWLPRAPRFRRVTPRPSAPVRKTLHRFEDMGRLLAFLGQRRTLSWKDHRLYALVAMVAHTGLRRDEALRARVEDIRLAEGLLLVVARVRLKTEAAAAPVPIAPDLARILAEWIPRTASAWLFPGTRRRGPWVGGNVHDRPLGQLAAVGLELGIDGLTFQSLRHTFATYCRRRFGLSGIQLRDILRHTTEETQEHYVHAELDYRPLVESVKAVSYG